MDTLPAAGYAHYEISNYARPGLRIPPQLRLLARPRLPRLRPQRLFHRGRAPLAERPGQRRIHRATGRGFCPVSFEEAISERTRAGETIAFGLRTDRGIPLPAAAPWQAEVEELHTLGLLESSRDGRLRLTRRGKLMADSVAEAFV